MRVFTKEEGAPARVHARWCARACPRRSPSARMEEVPSILGHKDVLRQRLTRENALREAAVAARAKVFWQQRWNSQALPLTAATVQSTIGGSSPLVPVAPTGVAAAVPTRAIYNPVALDEYWNPVSFFGLRRDRLLFLAHSVCAGVHTTFALVTCFVSASSTDPYLDTWRQRFVFTRNTTECGLYTNFTDAGESRVTAVLIPDGELHTGWATAGFFLLSAVAHLLWVAACLYDPLGNKLLVWLADAWAPTRWIEYTCACSPHPSCHTHARCRHSGPAPRAAAAPPASCCSCSSPSRAAAPSTTWPRSSASPPRPCSTACSASTTAGPTPPPTASSGPARRPTAPTACATGSRAASPTSAASCRTRSLGLSSSGCTPPRWTTLRRCLATPSPTSCPATSSAPSSRRS